MIKLVSCWRYWPWNNISPVQTHIIIFCPDTNVHWLPFGLQVPKEINGIDKSMIANRSCHSWQDSLDDDFSVMLVNHVQGDTKRESSFGSNSQQKFDYKQSAGAPDILKMACFYHERCNRHDNRFSMQPSLVLKPYFSHIERFRTKAQSSFETLPIIDLLNKDWWTYLWPSLWISQLKSLYLHVNPA